MPTATPTTPQLTLRAAEEQPTGPAPFESWGRYPTYGAKILPLHWQSDFPAVTAGLHNGALPVGMGRSYGDVCLLKDGNLLVTGAAALIAVTSYGPFGEPEQATGRWLPWLRLATALALAVAAFALLAAGATGGYLPGGSLALLRNFAGMTGIGLLSATALGGAFGWTGPMGYLLITEGALAGGWTTPWIWPGRPAGDLGGALCASAVFAAGLAAAAVLGARAAGRRPAPE